MALLALLPTWLVLFNDYWPFTSSHGQFIDPWLYPSYFLHLKAQLLAFPTAYYGDRLSDTLPGWAIYHLFGPWAGNYVFKLAVIYTAVFSMYFTLSRLFNRRVALISGLLVCSQPYFLMAFGWDYVDGIGIAFCSLALLFAFRAAQSESNTLPLLFAGIFCVCLITSQLLWLNLVWVVPLAYLLAAGMGCRSSAGLGLVAGLQDLALTGVAFLVAYWVRTRIPTAFAVRRFVTPEVYPLGRYVLLFPMIVAAWQFSGYLLGTYRELESSNRGELVSNGLKMVALGAVIINAGAFLFRADYISRAFILIFITFDLLLVTAGRLFLGSQGNWRRDKVRVCCKSLMVGEESAAPRWRNAAVFAFGCLATFAVFCGIYYRITGNWLYLANSLSHTSNSFGAAQQVNQSLSVWLRYSNWMVHYNGIILIAVWLIFRRRTLPRERLCLALFATAYATIWAWQAVRFPFVMLFWYTSFLFPFYALGLAAVLNRPLNRLAERISWYPAATCLFVSVVLYSLVDFWYRLGMTVSHVGSWLYEHEMVVLSLMLFVVTIPICILRLKRSWSLVFFLIGVFSVYAAQLILLPQQGWFAGVEYTNKQAFRMILDADAWVDQRQPDRKLLWWTDKQEPKQSVIYGVTSQYLWAYSILNQDFPQLSLQDVDQLAARPTVLVLSWKPDSVDKAREVLSSRGLFVAKEETTTITSGPLALNLGLFHIGNVGSLSNDFVAEQGLQEIPGVFQVNQILPAAPGASFENGTSFRVIGRAQQWAYLAYLPLQFPENADELWVRLTVKVLKGQIGFGILNGKETDFYDRKFQNADGEFHNVLLDVAHPAESRKLIIENGEIGGKESEVIVQKIALFARPDSPVWKMVQKQARQKGTTNVQGP